jgi:hypothetical protein
MQCPFLLQKISECLVYYVNDGVTLIGSDPLGDIQLSGADMRPRHAVITFTSSGYERRLHDTKATPNTNSPSFFRPNSNPHTGSLL